jgi:NifU-like protein involved in Fe-S cluster formation
MACGSALTELVKDKTLAEASEVGKENVIQLLVSLPQASSHAAQLAVETLALLLRNAGA